ncbi:hypothetical protein Hypma_004395 [Hypsizygus marmoreus]|uniref:Uncharacterized protein n=1 Tax=Hypsizygus marmoreus TaxID=39966 RepID=A0A369K8I4_HYPMA|nr:hypothetical protein Hypma_004395 [Hypsizygus marmoreus]
MDLDPLDLALLIGMAQRQKKRCVRANEYTAHVLYPSGTQKELFVLTAIIPLQTLERLRERARRCCRYVSSRPRWPLSVQTPLQQNALVKMLAALINHVWR